MTLASMARKYEARKAPEGERQATSAMIASLAAEGYDTVAAPFGNALVDAARKDDRIVGLTADLGKYTDLHIFQQARPDRFYQMGMAEQVLMSAAAGLAREGFIPFATTYAVFASRRAYDFIAMAIAEENLPVKIVCALPGLIFRGLPNMTLIDPCDADDILGMVPQMIAHDGPVYSRLLRGKVPSVIRKHKPDYRFQLGKAQMIREGKDVLVISTGLMTMRALDAAVKLAGDKVDVAVLHCPTIKPLDLETIAAEAAKDGRLVVTAENHTLMGGLGEAVAAGLLSRGIAPRFRMIGLPDAFLEAGALPTLHEMYGISVGKVIEQIKGWL